MYRSMLFLHWKQIRHVLALAVIASFSLPLLAVQGMGAPPGTEFAAFDAYRFVAAAETWVVLFPTLAMAIGVTLALSAWNWDHQLKHVYALSLPMTRWEYSLQKLLAGMTLCLGPAAGLWIGAHVAAGSIELPAGLHAYPNELAVRFLFAMLLSYAALFAMAAGTIRTTIWVVGTILGFILFGAMAGDLLADYFVRFDTANLVDEVSRWLLEAPGPLEVFTGSWSLIDV